MINVTLGQAAVEKVCQKDPEKPQRLGLFNREFILRYSFVILDINISKKNERGHRAIR